MAEKKKFYSIRVVRATNTEKAIEKVEDADFDEDDLICDKVLDKKEIIKELLGDSFVLTNEEGDILGVVTGTHKEIKSKVIDILSQMYNDVKIRGFNIGLFTVTSPDLSSKKELYLTSTQII